MSYPAVVTAVKAYLDGYASRQNPYAPMQLALGTNNDMDVSAAAGRAWALNVVNPITAYTARYPNITIAGADDMEPGFSADVSQTRAWLTGYLAATSAPFVFNGSADGCPTGSPGGPCNQGWTEGDLAWLSGGAAPNRIISLPQIYNTAMPHQWTNISVTAVRAGWPKIDFGGPLTEWTACGSSCNSITNVYAWQQLWAAINADPATRQTEMRYGTDLQIY
jgi:hypothetical protein